MSRVSFVASAAAGLALSATPLLAADMYGGGTPAPAAGYGGYVAAPPANWNGAYVGVQGGTAWGTVRNRVKGVSSRETDADGGVAGLYAGVNTHIGPNFVVGAEADVNVSGQSGTTVHGGKPYRSESDWNGTVRGRVGVAFDRVLPYATGGIAFVDNSMRGNGRNASSTELGVALGAGVEGKITDRVSAKLEYMYVGAGEANHRLGGQRVGSDLSSNTLRGGVGYKF